MQCNIREEFITVSVSDKKANLISTTLRLKLLHICAYLPYETIIKHAKRFLIYD